ncbi:MAG: galactose oxidase-like domain-containing protein [Gemmatimonadales bacterium]
MTTVAVRHPSPSLTALTATTLLFASCYDGGQAPPARPEIPSEEGAGGSMLSLTVDLVYVCDNKFLVTNAASTPVEMRYRVAGTSETGAIALEPGPGGDPGYSETELQTAATGAVELFHDDQLVARRRNEGLACGPASITAAAASAEAAAGRWGAVFFWPIVAVHLHLLPTGRVLSWGLAGQPQVWNPGTGAFSQSAEPVEIFCAGHAFLSDGRLLVTGGHISDDHGLPDITLFSPGDQSWTRSTRMRRGRWYPTNTTLASGEVVILAGRDEAGLVVNEPEVWSPGGVRVLTGASRSLPYYPRTFLAPNGRVFLAGEERKSRYLNTSGAGSWTAVGDRLYGTRDYGAAVMYDDGKILFVGGGRTTNTAEIIDLNAASPRWQWTGSMALPRRHLNATVLPTGEVLVTGGSSGTKFDDYTRGARTAELWNPATGVWTTLASAAVNRSYHATSLLLPDGRVLHTGSGSRTSPNQLNAELFSPPYLFKGPRPRIGSAPSSVRYGNSFRVATAQAGSIAQVSLIRLGSVTHAFDMNQRFQRLAFTRQSDALTVSAPSDARRTPPGHYLLFILNGDGVPSVAKIIRIY